MPKVTVIIPVFNGQTFLIECLDSVFKQSFQNFEVIAVDDGSTDKTGVIMKSYGKKIRVITNKRNIGQGLSRNKALKMARGKFVLFLDSDDLLHEDCLKLTVQAAGQGSTDFVRFDWSYLVSSKKGWIEQQHTNKLDFMHKSQLKGNECVEVLKSPHYFSVLCLYNKDFLIKNKIDYDKGQLYEDVVFMVKTAVSAKRLSIVNKPLYIVRKNPASVTSSWRKSNRHPKAFTTAVKKAFTLTEGNKEATTYVASVFVNKFNLYYKTRTAKDYKQIFLEDFWSSLSNVQDLLAPDLIQKGLSRQAMSLLNARQFKRLINRSPIIHRKINELLFNRYY